MIKLYNQLKKIMKEIILKVCKDQSLRTKEEIHSIRTNLSTDINPDKKPISSIYLKRIFLNNLLNKDLILVLQNKNNQIYKIKNHKLKNLNYKKLKHHIKFNLMILNKKILKEELL